VAAGLAISGVFDLGALRDSPHVNDKVKLSEEAQRVFDLGAKRKPEATSSPDAPTLPAASGDGLPRCTPHFRYGS
jgi:hypothetical protein